MKNNSETDALTELEGAALAIIQRVGASTAYEIKEGFSRSPSSYWSGSAGSVYPMMKRLEGKGLVSSRDLSQTNRPKRVFDLTRKGLSALEVWLLDAERASDAGYDPLRTRLAFIELVDRDAAQKMLDQVEAAYLKMEAPADDDRFVAFHKSWLKVRLDWIRQARSQLE